MTKEHKIQLDKYDGFQAPMPQPTPETTTNYTVWVNSKKAYHSPTRKIALAYYEVCVKAAQGKPPEKFKGKKEEHYCFGKLIELRSPTGKTQEYYSPK